MKDFKEEAADWCEDLDDEDGEGVEEGRDAVADAEDDLFTRKRKESEEFDQMEARFRGKRGRKESIGMLKRIFTLAHSRMPTS